MVSVVQNRADLVAAELILGSLDSERAAAARARCERDPDFALRVDRWRERLFPLSQALPPVDPPEVVWQGIEGRLPPAPPRPLATRAPARRWLVGWGAAAMAASGVLALVFSTEMLPPRDGVTPGIGTELWAESDSLAWVVTLDRRAGLLSLRREGEPASGADHDHELWLIALDGSVQSLGLLPDDATANLVLRPVSLDLMVPGATLAVSREPLGGSPDAGPSGTVIASAKLSLL